MIALQKGIDPTLEEIVGHLNFVYGDKVKTEFDKLCIEKYEIITENGEPKFLFVYYNRVKVTITNIEGYWPIAIHQEEMGLQSLKKISEGIL